MRDFGFRLYFILIVGICGYIEEMVDVCFRFMNDYFYCGFFLSEWNGFLFMFKN